MQRVFFFKKFLFGKARIVTAQPQPATVRSGSAIGLGDDKGGEKKLAVERGGEELLMPGRKGTVAKRARGRSFAYCHRKTSNSNTVEAHRF